MNSPILDRQRGVVVLLVVVVQAGVAAAGLVVVVASILLVTEMMGTLVMMIFRTGATMDVGVMVREGKLIESDIVFPSSVKHQLTDTDFG